MYIIDLNKLHIGDIRIAKLFSSIITKRNRIIHGFQIRENNEQVLCTKTKNNEQFTITERFLLEFIEENGKLSSLLHKLRGY